MGQTCVKPGAADDYASFKKGNKGPPIIAATFGRSVRNEAQRVPRSRTGKKSARGAVVAIRFGWQSYAAGNRGRFLFLSISGNKSNLVSVTVFGQPSGKRRTLGIRIDEFVAS
jgi:hypothetical protein